MTITIDLIAAARPNFMKVAPLYKVLKSQDDWCRPRLVHTGQHYDANMSDAFFSDLSLPVPYAHLGVGSGSHAEQTAAVMIAYERLCKAERPDWTIVVGDVNSTIACTLAAAKLGIPVAHLEAGLRSGDRTMPEEINRIVTDSIADLLWTPSPDADANLAAEGVLPGRICQVGNIMIDAFEMMRARIASRRHASKLGLDAARYAVVTLHRPSNVDTRDRLHALVTVLGEVAKRLSVVFPVHPRTRQRLEEFGLLDTLSRMNGIRLIDPLGYIDFMSLIVGATLVATDSGGIQEETTYLGIPCLTLRENTERPITLTEGTNRLVRVEQLVPATDEVLDGGWPQGRKPALWDGHTAERVAASLRSRASSG